MTVDFEFLYGMLPMPIVFCTGLQRSFVSDAHELTSLIVFHDVMINITIVNLSFSNSGVLPTPPPPPHMPGTHVFLEQAQAQTQTQTHRHTTDTDSATGTNIDTHTHTEVQDIDTDTVTNTDTYTGTLRSLFGTSELQRANLSNLACSGLQNRFLLQKRTVARF